MSHGDVLWSIANSKADAPCKGCSDRNIGCHSTCASYISYKKAFVEAKKKAYVKTREAYSMGPRERRRLYLKHNS